MPEEKKVFRTVNSLFYNSQCLFVEFHDVIAMPWLTMLKINLDAKAINKIFKVDGFTDYSTNALLEWYLYRKKRNVYEEIGVRETINPPEDFYNGFLKLCMTECDYSIDVYKINTNLKFAETCDELNHKKSFVKKIVFYSEYEEPGISEYIKKWYKNPDHFEYRFGDLKDVLKDIPNDSTFVFSDIEKVNTLVETGKINMSTVMIPFGLRYNYTEDDPEKLKVDIEKLSENYVFKGAFFNNFDVSVNDDIFREPDPENLNDMIRLMNNPFNK